MPPIDPATPQVRESREAHQLALAMSEGRTGSGHQAETLLRMDYTESMRHNPGSPAAAQAEMQQVTDMANREVAASGFPSVRIEPGRDANGRPRFFLDRYNGQQQERWNGRTGQWDVWNGQMYVPPMGPAGMPAAEGYPGYYGQPSAQLDPNSQWGQEARKIALYENAYSRGHNVAYLYAARNELSQDVRMLGNNPQNAAFLNQFLTTLRADEQSLGSTIHAGMTMRGGAEDVRLYGADQYGRALGAGQGLEVATVYNQFIPQNWMPQQPGAAPYPGAPYEGMPPQPGAAYYPGAAPYEGMPPAQPVTEAMPPAALPPQEMYPPSPYAYGYGGAAPFVSVYGGHGRHGWRHPVLREVVPPQMMAGGGYPYYGANPYYGASYGAPAYSALAAYYSQPGIPLSFGFEFGIGGRRRFI